MDAAELVRRAWEAVKEAGVPEPLQQVAFQEAVAYLRDAEAETSKGSSGAAGATRTKASKTGKKAAASAATSSDEPAVDEATFYSQLAKESGVDEQDLKDILQVTKDRKVHVTSATKNLGASMAEQAKTVIALVSGARAIGLGEVPVHADSVRQEAKRKRAHDPTNFSKSLTPMKGFNSGSTRNEIVLTSKWVGEFKAAVDKAQGRSPDKDKPKPS